MGINANIMYDIVYRRRAKCPLTRFCKLCRYLDSACTVGLPLTAGVNFTRAVIVPAAAFCTTQPIAAVPAMPTTLYTRVTLDTSAITSNGWFRVSCTLHEARRGERDHDFGGSRLTLQSLLYSSRKTALGSTREA